MLDPHEVVRTHRRGEVLAAAAVLIVLAHALFAQLTGLTALVCYLTGRATRWRPAWLAVPAAAGLVWTLAIGARPAVAGLLAGPDHILSFLTTRSESPAGTFRLPDVFAGAGYWLPRQFPLALVAGSAEAALAGLVSGRAGGTRRPGAVATVRRTLNLRLLRAGELRARAGAVVGVDPLTGAPVAVGWTELTTGVLATGRPDNEVTATALHLVRAALRHRKPVIVLDLMSGNLDAWLWTECAKSSCPVATGDLLAAVRGRAIALLDPAGDPATACRRIIDLCAELRRIGADGDGLVWLNGREGLPGPLIAELAAAGATAGLPLLLSTSGPLEEFTPGLVISHDGGGRLSLGARRVITG
jgi:hypothetical protein